MDKLKDSNVKDSSLLIFVNFFCEFFCDFFCDLGILFPNMQSICCKSVENKCMEYMLLILILSFTTYV